MKNAELADINFREIIDYGGQPPVEVLYSSSPKCHGYCVSCEDDGILASTGGSLELMSHGCDSSDFETVLGKMPREEPSFERPVLFLLENPGADYGNGEAVDFRGFRKKPPTNHYYWTPNVGKWPVNVADFRGNFYGPYFAYLMRRHQLLNVYITNLIKCKWVKGKGQNQGSTDPSAITQNCGDRFLAREIKIFAPEISFCFGREAKRGLQSLLSRTKQASRVVYLRHPAFIQAFHQTVHKTQEELVAENDELIHNALAQSA